MSKIQKQLTRLFLTHTPPYTRPTVQRILKLSNLHLIQDKKLQPMIHYIEALQKHKEYLNFFQIGIIRNQKKKIQNVAKYVGLAIRDYSQQEMDNKLEKLANQQKTNTSNIEQNKVNNDIHSNPNKIINNIIQQQIEFQTSNPSEYLIKQKYIAQQMEETPHKHK